jgi:hypothetical protein
MIKNPETSYELHELSQQWIVAKADEQAAQDRRRQIEDTMSAIIKLPEDFEGTKSFDAGSFRVSTVGRINHKIDSAKLQEVAAEHGLSEHLSTLFRWKPEISAKNWKAADASIITPLLEAITATPGRPSFSISVKKDK